MAPQATLEVQSSTATTGLVTFRNEATNAGFKFDLNDGSDLLNYGAPNRHAIRTGTGESLLLRVGLGHDFILAEDGSVGIGAAGYMRSLLVPVSGTSASFDVPSGFVGHLYLRFGGGNEQAVFLVGSDGNANFEGPAGFAQLVVRSSATLDTLVLDYDGARPRRWELMGVPASTSEVVVFMVGAVSRSHWSP